MQPNMPILQGVFPLKTLLLSGYGIRTRYRKGLLILESKTNGKQEIPLADIHQVIVVSSGIWFSSKLVRKLIEHGVDLVFLDSRGLPVGRIYPPYINKTVETRRAQYSAHSTHRGINITKEIVYAKLVNQANLLKKYYYYTRIEDLRENSGKIIDLATKARNFETSFNDIKEKLRSIEAEAAKFYWPSYALLLPRELNFEGRDQDSDDPVNTSLNYSYGILYNECWKALVLAGLDPYAGFLHVDRSGKPVLVFDFVEMFRFIADNTLLAMFRKGWKPRINNGLLDYESRLRIIENINKFMEDTKTHYLDESPVNLKQVIKKTSFALASYLRGEGVFEGYVHRW